jgi:hypothetical protein
LQGRNGTCTRRLPCPFAASSKSKIQRPRRSNTNIKEKGKRKGGNKAANKKKILGLPSPLDSSCMGLRHGPENTRLPLLFSLHLGAF